MKSIKKFLKANKYLLLLLVLWRLFLFIPQIWAYQNLDIQQHYLGGGQNSYLLNPWLWGWANFDGEHYLGIAQFGYRPLTYFFFPLYPVVIRFISEIVGVTAVSRLTAALVISHFSFFLGMLGFYKLLKLDYKKHLVNKVILLLLVFPTSFYFAAVYTESLFFALIIWSFYFARSRRWLFACVLAGLATSTRLVGVVMLPALAIEYLFQNKQLFTSFNFKRLLTVHSSLFTLLLIPLGLISYMLYLNQTTGDPLAFFHSVEIFGQQRSSTFVILPQVFYRYIFKIIPFVPISYWQGFFVTWLELATGALFLLLSIWSLWKVRASYALFIAGAYLLPTLSGSFSSLPRYVLICFPGFIISAMLINRLPKVIQYAIILALLASLFISQGLFFRGYWLS